MPPIQRLMDFMPTVGPWFDAGVRYPHYSGNDPLCCPGRAAFLSGQYSKHHGVVENDGTPFDPTVTLATRLHDAGYWTAIAGKYLNGMSASTPPGWDRLAIFDGGYYDYTLYRDGVPEPHGAMAADYSTDVLADAAVGILRSAPSDQPVFLDLTPFAVHKPAASDDPLPTVAPRHEKDPRCASVGVKGGPAYDEADVSDKPGIIRREPLQPYAGGWPLIRACRALLSVDDMFARVRAELGAQGRLADTLFLFTADNGMTWGQHRWYGKQVPYATPIPLYVRWGTPSAHVNTSWVTNVDLAPSLAAVAGTSMGMLTNGHGVDGLDISSLFDGTGTLARTALYEERYDIAPRTPAKSGWTAIRTTDRHPRGLWHYVEWATGERELYDLTNDPNEVTNLHRARGYATTERTLHDELATQRAPP